MTKASRRNVAIGGFLGALLVVILSGPALALTMSQFFGGNLPKSHVVSESAWGTRIGDQMNAHLTGAFSLAFGYSHIETRTSSGAAYSAEATGTGANLDHRSVPNAWGVCWWGEIATSPSSVSAQCDSKRP